ncbi:MAG: methyltransferase domain-containing protein [Deltaproteobacteria bacterium]|nr:methyltransferase domain-containing protein [Deltaproteobacteria bacterium]
MPTDSFPRLSVGELSAWRAAQRYELDYWEERGAASLRAQSERFAHAARRLAGLLDEHATTDWRRSALQLGTAGIAEIHHLPARARFAVEPLACALDQRGLLVRDDVTYVSAMGERLPFPDAAFSVALVPNVLDHVARPGQLLAEVHRCLEPGALLWLSCHVSPAWAIGAFRVLHGMGAGYFAGHPWYFTADALRSLTRRAGFRVRLERSGAVDEAHADIRTGVRAHLKRRPHTSSGAYSASATCCSSGRRMSVVIQTHEYDDRRFCFPFDLAS